MYTFSAPSSSDLELLSDVRGYELEGTRLVLDVRFLQDGHLIVHHAIEQSDAHDRCPDSGPSRGRCERRALHLDVADAACVESSEKAALVLLSVLTEESVQSHLALIEVIGTQCLATDDGQFHLGSESREVGREKRTEKGGMGHLPPRNPLHVLLVELAVESARGDHHRARSHAHS
ncbi:hypothetical protein PENTCL1PPCAC_23678 [Pristionchus entomophagus]|uniref:Uncharacterized protein n=1 Tax=Pristionchus entomophagus TaxID=358040 RepID=A0AAV5U3T7_9BILA|nr:hypothetical protein PENTCL1PPCAC_23678 [Pristionchus entomophagus]